jgi:protein SCO1/2
MQTGDARRPETGFPNPNRPRNNGMHRSGLVLITTLAALTTASTLLAKPPADAPATPPAKDRTEPMPQAFKGVGIDEHLDAQLPLSADFVDHDGNKVKLGDYFDGKRPVILTLNYFRCPQLCGFQLNEMMAVLKRMDWLPGDKFQVLTVSFDPLESHPLAAIKRRNYLEAFGDPQAGVGWHFLTGRQAAVKALLDTTGFRVRYDEGTGEWAHTTALILCTPDGHISRYLYQFPYDGRTLRLSLVEAGEGKIGSPVDQILLYCFHFDGESEGYALAAFNIARAGAGLTALAVTILLVTLWRRDRKKTKPAVQTT